jgi:hypothetical protein
MSQNGYPCQDWIVPPSASVLRLKRGNVEEVVPGRIITPGLDHSTLLVRRTTLEPGRDGLRLEPQAAGLLLAKPSDPRSQMAEEGEVLQALNAQAVQKALLVSLRPATVVAKSRSFVLDVAQKCTCIV